MKNRFIVVYTVFISIVFLFALIFFGGNLYSEYSSGYARTQRRFDSMVSSIRRSADDYPPGTREFTAGLQSSIGSLDDFAVLIIYLDDQAFYLFPDANPAPIESDMIHNASTEFFAGGFDFKIEASLYKLRPATVSHYVKVSFLIILIGTLTTALLLIYMSIFDKSGAEYPADDAAQDEDNEQYEIEIEDVPPENVRIVEPEPAEQVSAEAGQPPEPEPVASEAAPETETVFVSTEPELEPEAAAKTELPVEEKPAEAPGESGVFSTTTGLAGESFLLKRLSIELERVTASETDLALFIIRLPGTARDSEAIKNICEYLMIQFQFKDLLFEYKEDCFAAIKIGMNLDESVMFAETLHADIKKLLGNDGDCFMGISTRTIRMISAQRLLNEATEALYHAEASPEKIIAFKADIEKYKKYLEEN